MDTNRLKEAWDRFQRKMRSLRERQLAALRRFSSRAEAERIRKIQDSLK